MDARSPSNESTPRDAEDDGGSIAKEAERLTKAHLAAVAYIEAHLFEPMTVKSIADHACFSSSKFSRGFTRLQGESVMAYVRGRRLEEALRRMRRSPARPFRTSHGSVRSWPRASRGLFS